MGKKGVVWRKGFRETKPYKRRPASIVLTTKQRTRMTAESIDDSMDAVFGPAPRQKFRKSIK